MVDRLGLVAILLVPDARPPVQLRDLVGLLVEQVRLQYVRKQAVVAIPLATIIERGEEQVPLFQRSQLGLATDLTGDGIAQRAVQPLQDGGL